jgi:AbrB family looped-hinge helix DNA binding protein
MTTATLSSKGQITIPLIVRQKLGVTTGDRVEFVELADGQFALVPAVTDVRTLKGIVPKPPHPVSVEEMRRVVARRGAGK